MATLAQISICLSIYLNTILVFDQVDWALLPLSTYTLVPLFPAGCATPVPAGFHVDPSIATLRHQADPVHRDTAC